MELTSDLEFLFHLLLKIQSFQYLPSKVFSNLFSYQNIIIFPNLHFIFIL